MKRTLSLSAALVFSLLLGGVTVPALSPLLAQEAAFNGPATIVTLDPKGKGELAAPVPATAVKVKVNGKDAKVTSWSAYGPNATQPNLQLVLLIDDAARSSLGLHLQEMQRFITQQLPTTEVAVIYMRNGTAAFTEPFTTNHEQAAQALRLPVSGGAAGSSPYFALSDLMKRWPAHNPGERREVVMVTDAGEEILRAGDCAAFPKNDGNGHHLINRSGQDVQLLEIRTRSGGDTAAYPDIDLLLDPAKGGYTHKDGTPYR